MQTTRQQRRFMRPAFVRVLLLPAILFTAFGCHDNRSKFPEPPANARPESVVSETRAIEIGSETFHADYGTITVPENRGKSTSRLISVPWLRIHAHALKPADPIFGLAGGPGATNMSWDGGKTRTFLDAHDYVLVGYRGVDGSIVLDCPEVSQALKRDVDPLGKESMEAIARAWNTAAKRLMAEGIDLDGYTMLETIEDNESVRRALGYERINLLSESYGTRVAYLYALRHPERISRSAMISVNPPGRFVWEPEMIDRQLKHYAMLWSKDSAMSRKSTDLYATLRAVLGSMPDRWLFLPINPGKVRVATFGLLFHRRTAALVFDAYTAAEQGDPSGLALMSLAYDYLIPSMFVWGDLASKGSVDFDSARDYYHEMKPPDKPLGSPMGTLLWGPLSSARWPTRQLPAEFRQPRHSDVETLLLSGSVDFSTPSDFATEDLLPYLKNGKQIVLSECGHVNDLWYANIENTRLILTSYYTTGVPNTSLNSYIPMDFSVGWGFPGIAKAVLGGATFLMLALIALILRLATRRHAWKGARGPGTPSIPPSSLI